MYVMTSDDMIWYDMLFHEWHYLIVNIGEECPPFEGVLEFSRISCGGSIGT